MTTAFLAMVSMASGTVTGKVTANGTPLADAVVWLEGSVKSKPMSGARIDQKGLRFVPHVLVVTKDTKVDFPNDDTVYHNVFAQYHAKKFDLGLYPKGSSRSMVFDRTGTVSLMCNIHSEMSGYIIIVDTPYHAVTDRHGDYTIKDVAPGAYQAKGWHESGKTGSKEVTIGSGGAQVDVAVTK